MCTMTRSKYGAKRTEVDGIVFASKREAKRYCELKMLERVGQVKELELQPKFPLYVCGRKNGELHQVCVYIADFRYRTGVNGVLIIEDAKGMKTPTYRLKKKMVEAQYGIEIQEV